MGYDLINQRIKEKSRNLYQVMKDSTNYKQLIRLWHAKASEEDYFSKFVFEYLAFIAFLKTQKYDGVATDRNAIQSLKRDETIKNQYLLRVRNNKGLKTKWETIKAELDRLPLGNASRGYDNNVEEIRWWNCPHNQLRDKTLEEKNKKSGVLYSLEDWENMVEFWYTIRNNLFHGTKSPERKRDKVLVEYAYKTLKPLLEIFLKPTEDDEPKA